MESVHIEQADNDLFTFGETIKDYISIIQSAKVIFCLALAYLHIMCKFTFYNSIHFTQLQYNLFQLQYNLFACVSIC